ncbi:MAG: PIN domain-containing protein [Cytophagales bacterium]|nr:MAG: PIN domain-containing protein [Cytophagales bacterium]
MLSGKVELVITTEILFEYEKQLSLFYSPKYAKLVVNAICNLPNTKEVNPIYFNWLLIQSDNDDNKFVDAYIAGQAEFIITNQCRLVKPPISLSPWGKIKIGANKNA